VVGRRDGGMEGRRFGVRSSFCLMAGSASGPLIGDGVGVEMQMAVE
jgi:hypothetical protein